MIIALPLRTDDRQRPEFVRYCSPYGTPQWMDRVLAERRLAADLKVWNREHEEGQLTPRQLEHGPPRIER